MEFFSVLLAGLFGSLSPFGWIVDEKVEAAFRSRVLAVETLAVRVDNRPSYRLIQGKIQRLRLASHGVDLTPNLRLQSFAVETDPIAIDFGMVRGGKLGSLAQVQSALKQPLRAGLQVTLTQTDINRFLASDRVKKQLSAIAQRIAQQLPNAGNQDYELLSSTVEFRDDQRLGVNLKLRVSRPQREAFRDFTVHFASELNIQQGQQLLLVDPVVRVEGKPLSGQFVNILRQRIQSRFNLGSLDEKKITARLLQLKIEEDEVKLAAFVQIASGAGNDSLKISEK